MNGLMTGEVARAMMADRERAYGRQHRIEAGERPQRARRLLTALAGVIGLAMQMRPQSVPRVSSPIRTTPEPA